MANARERIVILESDAATRESLQAGMQSAGYDATAFATAHEGLDAIHATGADLLLLDSRLPDASAREALATIRGSAATEAVRVILLVGPGAEERATAIDLGADDAISRPWESSELLARTRAQFRMQRAEKQLRDKMRLAEEGQQIAHTAFEALAVTEKMTSDAFILDRRLKIGFGAVFALAAIMAIIYFGFARSAQKATQRANATIAKLEGGIVHQQDLMAEARKLREQAGPETAAVLPSKDELKRHADELKSKMARANSGEMTSLQQQLQETNERLKRVEKEGSAAQTLIPADVQSVCLLHVSVAFRHKDSGKRLRYAGKNPQGDPLQDSKGNPILTLEGNGPEVKFDIFGTGFLVGPGGRVLTNRHVAEPWWKNDELGDLVNQGFQPEISLIRAYFPNDARAFHAEIQEISQTTDLATMRVDVQDLKRTVLSVDTSTGAATTGEPIILMGYATGLAAILARTDEDSAQQILQKSSGDVSDILDEIARRNLIHPLITQGHIGDVLPDKIVFDAQTTSGGSGGPLFNRQGKVIGVTYAVLKGFGGSNFGIPIRLSQPLLGQ
ncbi:MAG: trypsin-like peptidase domain-containing protein [Candidatus Acidiferrales bacterium]